MTPNQSDYTAEIRQNNTQPPCQQSKDCKRLLMLVCGYHALFDLEIDILM